MFLGDLWELTSKYVKVCCLCDSLDCSDGCTNMDVLSYLLLVLQSETKV